MDAILDESIPSDMFFCYMVGVIIKDHKLIIKCCREVLGRNRIKDLPASVKYKPRICTYHWVAPPNALNIKYTDNLIYSPYTDECMSFKFDPNGESGWITYDFIYQLKYNPITRYIASELYYL